ncbi:hypothetical protein NNO_0214 [Hydrogenimonas sp.]|nr:hypothetical protein NNO_0214 [Hydrogenimonas sp.]
MRLLEDTQQQLDAMGPLKRALLTISASGMIAAGVWFGFIEDLEADIERRASQNIQLQRQIEISDPARVSVKIAKLRRERLAAAEELEKSLAARRYLKTRMERLQKLKFDHERMADLLDGVLKRSVELGLRLDMIESVDSRMDVTPLLERKKRIEVEGAGAFGNIVKLTHYIESLPILARIDSLAVFLDDRGKTAFKIAISTYGVKE